MFKKFLIKLTDECLSCDYTSPRITRLVYMIYYYRDGLNMIKLVTSYEGTCDRYNPIFHNHTKCQDLWCVKKYNDYNQAGPERIIHMDYPSVDLH